jgi:hypothetical protein
MQPEKEIKLIATIAVSPVKLYRPKKRGIIKSFRGCRQSENRSERLGQLRVCTFLVEWVNMSFSADSRENRGLRF